jgi:hypothetical protein
MLGAHCSCIYLIFSVVIGQSGIIFRRTRALKSRMEGVSIMPMSQLTAWAPSICFWENCYNCRAQRPRELGVLQDVIEVGLRH